MKTKRHCLLPSALLGLHVGCAPGEIGSPVESAPDEALGTAADAIAASKEVSITDDKTLFKFGAGEREGALFTPGRSQFLDDVSALPLANLRGSLVTDKLYDFARAYFFLHDPVELHLKRLQLGSGRGSTCYQSNGPLSSTIGYNHTPIPVDLWSGHAQPVSENLDLGDFFNPGAPADTGGGHVQGLLIADDGPCSYPVDGYDIMGGIQEAFWERFRHEVLTVGGHNSIELWYSKAIQALSGQKDSETFWNGFMLDFSVTVDISPDPLGSPTVCSTSVHAYSLNGGVEDSSPSAVEELVGGILTLTGGVASSNADGGLGEDELEATITEALNKQLAPGVTGSLLSGESMRQTSDPFSGKNPLKPDDEPLTCEVGGFGACTLEAGALSEGVRRAIKYVFREPSMHPYLPAWYWDDLPNFGSADDEAEFWERYQQQLQEAIFQNLSPAAQTHPNEFGDGELQSRTSFRNWRCIHDASRDKPGLGRCEVVPRAVRLSRKPGGIHLVWFDNPWADHQNPDGSLSDAAFNIALWVASHAPAEDGPVVEPDDIVKGSEALCAATKPQWASMSHSPPYSKGYHYWKP